MNKHKSIFIPAWMKVLPRLNNNIASNVERDVNMTWSHIALLVRTFEKLGWITREKQGRRYLCNLTTKGLEVAAICNQMMEEVKNV